MPQKILHPSRIALNELDGLTEQPSVAWPTLLLFVASCILWTGSTTLAIQGQFAIGWAIVLNALASYWFFTVFHEASHRAIGRSQQLNDWLGRLSFLPLNPFPIFRAFRFIHMQHHRFTNESSDKDPDAYTGEGPKWLLPLRWVTVDFKYYAYYLQNVRTRPRSEQMETLAAVLFGAVLVGLLIAQGWAMEMLLFWFIPSRIAMFFLALAFDYLPHHPKLATQRENPWRATNNRIGLEWLMTPLLLWQNYHLVHHLYPRAPFYRYVRIWKAGEREFRQCDPLLLNWRGQPVTDQMAR